MLGGGRGCVPMSRVTSKSGRHMALLRDGGEKNKRREKSHGT